MGRVVKDPAERRVEIIQASCRLFLSHGYENTTMRDVMECLQVAKGTIYHYFKSKEDILDAVIDYIVEQDFNKKKKVLENSSGTAVERLAMFIKEGSSDDSEHAEMLEDLHKPANVGMHLRLLARFTIVEAPLFAEVIEQGCREGVFATDYPLESAEFVLSGIQFLTDIGIYPWTEEQLRRRIRAIPRMVEAHLRAPVHSFDFLDTVLQEHYLKAKH